MGIDELKKKLEPAMRHVDLLCKGFSVEATPSYRSVLNTVCQNFEKKKTWQQEIREILFAVQTNKSIAKASSVYPLVTQFKDKFIHIAKTEIIPEIKLFCKKNPDIEIEDFRPLFEIRIKQI